MANRRCLFGLVLITLFLSGCSLFGQEAETQPEPAEEGETGETSEPSEIPPTETPEPFKPELVICAASEPEAIIGSNHPTAAVLLPLVAPQAAVYGSDYVAQPGDLLTALPTVEGGQLSRNDDGTLSVSLSYNYDLAWSDGEPFSLSDAQVGLTLPAASLAPRFDVVDSTQGDVALSVTAAPGVEYPYVPSQPPLPVHVLGEGVDPNVVLGSDYARLVNPSLGPYYVAEWVSGSHVLLQANPHYPGRLEIQNPTVRVRFMIDPNQAVDEVVSGGCDLVLDEALTRDQYRALMVGSAARALAYSSSIYERVIFNTRPGPFGRPAYFADPRVRQAVAYAIDRETLLQETYGAMVPVLDGWISSDHWASAQVGGLTHYAPDLATAASLLDQAGWQDLNGDGTREYHGEGGGLYNCQLGEWTVAEETALSPLLVFPEGDALRAQIAEKIRADLAQIGISVQVQPVSAAVMFSTSGPLAQQQFDMALTADLTRPDPTGISQWVGGEVYMHPLELRPVHRWELEDRWLTSEQQVEVLAYDNMPGAANDYQGKNFSGWCSDRANIAIVEANLPLNIAERQPFYAEQQAIVAQEVPVLPLFYRPQIALTAGYLCGVDPVPFGPVTWNITSWYFNENGACPY